MESTHRAILNHVGYHALFGPVTFSIAISIAILVTRLVAIFIPACSVVRGFCSLSELRPICLPHMVLLSAVVEWWSE